MSAVRRHVRHYMYVLQFDVPAKLHDMDRFGHRLMHMPRCVKVEASSSLLISLMELRVLIATNSTPSYHVVQHPSSCQALHQVSYRADNKVQLPAHNSLGETRLPKAAARLR